MFVKILALAKKPDLKVTPRNAAEADKLRLVKAVLFYAWRNSERAFKVRLPVFDLYFVKRRK